MHSLQLLRPIPGTKCDRMVGESFTPGRGDIVAARNFVARACAQAHLMAVVEQRFKKLPGTVMCRFDLNFGHNLRWIVADQ